MRVWAEKHYGQRTIPHMPWDTRECGLDGRQWEPGPRMQEQGQALSTGALQGESTQGSGTDSSGPAMQEGGGLGSPRLPGQRSQVLSAQGGLCFKGKMVPAYMTEPWANASQSHPARCPPAALHY